MKWAALSPLSLHSDIQAWTTSTKEKSSKHCSDDSKSIVWITRLDSLWSSLFGQTLLSHRCLYKDSSFGLSQSIRSLISFKNYRPNCGKIDRMLIFCCSIWDLSQMVKKQYILAVCALPQREKDHYFIMRLFLQLCEIIFVFPRTLPRPCGNGSVKSCLLGPFRKMMCWEQAQLESLKHKSKGFLVRAKNMKTWRDKPQGLNWIGNLFT